MGFPATIRVDQGTEFVSRYLDLWAYQRSVTLDFSRASNVRNSAWIAIAGPAFKRETTVLALPLAEQL